MRLPNKVQHHMTDKIRAKARELLSDDVYDAHYDDAWRIFVVGARCGRTSETRKTVTVPHWCFARPQTSIAVKRMKYTGPLDEYWIYYLAHELAHMVVLQTDGVANDHHGPNFMAAFKSICPQHLQFFELGYKPRHAAAAGIG